MSCKHDGKKSREGVCILCGEMPQETLEFMEKLRKEISEKLKADHSKGGKV